MIERWMLSVVVLGAVIAVGGTFLGHITSRAGVPRRWLWLALMITSVALPVALALRPTTQGLPQTQSAESVQSVESVQSARPVAASPVSDTTLLIGWALLSACLAGLFIATHRRTLAQVAAWQTRTVLGSSVTVSPDFGPAAVGFVHARVVLPAWALELPAEEQELVLRHEREHIESGDQYVLLTGVLMVVTMPWNLGLWWQLRRLRVGLELDCDARVAPALHDRPRYAQLLLRERGQESPHRLALALVPTPSALAERLFALLDRQRPTRRQLAAWSLSAMACAGSLVRIPVPNVRPLFAAVMQPAPLRMAAPIVAIPSVTPTPGVPSTPGPRHAVRKPASEVAIGTAPAPANADTRKVAIDSVPVAPAVKRIRYDSLLPVTPEMMLPIARGGRAGALTAKRVDSTAVPATTGANFGTTFGGGRGSRGGAAVVARRVPPDSTLPRNR